MPAPLTLLGAAALAGVGFFLYKNKKASVPGQVPGQLPGVVSTLTQGKSYAVIAVITNQITHDPLWDELKAAHPDWTNEAVIAHIITTRFQQVGCQVLVQPVLQNQTERTKAENGEPSAWTFTMKWLSGASYVTEVIPWLSNAAFVLLPSM